MDWFRQMPEGARAATVAVLTAVISLCVFVPYALNETGRLGSGSSSPAPSTYAPTEQTKGLDETGSWQSRPASTEFESDGYRPHVAENGSYYGEISENTGRPKTVYVRSYYRKDGTYIRGHFRSPPGGVKYDFGSGSYKPGVAENGSYYGETSSATGRPKTVRVRGYYRKDGTYVRGHYRSRPSR